MHGSPVEYDLSVNTVATPYLLQDVKVGTVILFEYYIESAYGWKASSLNEAFCPFELFDLFHKRETTACVRRRWIFRYTFDNALLHHVCGRFRNLGSVLRWRALKWPSSLLLKLCQGHKENYWHCEQAQESQRQKWPIPSLIWSCNEAINTKDIVTLSRSPSHRSIKAARQAMEKAVRGAGS